MAFNSSPFFNLVITTFIATLGGFLFGFDTCIMTGALIFIRQSFSVDIFTQSFIVSAVILGCLSGSLASGWLTHKYGSHRMLFKTSLLFILSTLMTALAPTVAILVVGRFLTGIAIGMTSYLSPLFIAEMAPAQLRGRLVVINSLMITSGQVVAFLINYLLINTSSWRLMFLTGLIPAVFLFIGMLIIPPSPRWLILKGEVSKARAIFLKIRKESDIDAEVKAIQSEAKKIVVKPQWHDIFSKKYFPLIFIGLGCGIFQQAIGINAIMYFAPQILKEVGLKTEELQLLATIGLGSVNMLMTLLTCWFIDYFPRRVLLLTGLTIAFISLLCVSYTLQTHTLTLKTAYLIYCEMLMFIAGYAISLGTLFWLLISEIYPLSIRSLAMSFVTASQWLACFITVSSFLPLQHALGGARIFYLFAFICFLSIIFTYYFVPETKDISLEQIEQFLQVKNSNK